MHMHLALPQGVFAKHERILQDFSIVDSGKVCGLSVLCTLYMVPTSLRPQLCTLRVLKLKTSSQNVSFWVPVPPFAPSTACTVA